MSAAPDPLHSALLQLVTEALAPTGEDARWPWRPVGSRSGSRDFWHPATWTLDDFDGVRTESRRLFNHCEFAIGGAVTRRNYIVGQGFKYEVVPRDEATPADAGLLREFNQFVTAFCELNRLPAVEKETQWRDDRDGETLHRLFSPEGEDIPAVRFVEPERLGEPTGDQVRTFEGDDGPPPDANNALGVCTPKGDGQTVLGYWVSPAPGEPVEWVTEREVVHIRCNVDSSCRRGLPTYYPVVENLRRAEDTLQSMGTMAKARAKVALIEYVQNLTGTAAESQKARLTTGYQTMPDGTARQTTIEEIPFGAYLRKPASSKMEFPSANVGASDLVGVLQADLRAVAKLLDMPEWMFTGLADQKYSNAFVVEAPTLKAFSAIQGDLVQAFGTGRYRQQASLVWRAIRMACERGVLPLAALPAIRVKVTPPSLEVRDKAAEATVNQTYVSMGARSVRRVIESLGDDPDQVLREVAEEKKAAQPTADPLGGGGTVPGLAGGAPTLESLGYVELEGEWYTRSAARWVLEGRDRSGLVRTVITNRLGRKQTVYRRPAGRTPRPKRTPAPTREQQESEAHARDALRGPARLTPQQVGELEAHLDRLPRETLRKIADDHAQAVGKTKADAARNLLAAVRRGHAAGEGLATGVPRQPAATVEVHTWSTPAEVQRATAHLFKVEPEAGDLAAAACGVDGGTVTLIGQGGEKLLLDSKAPGVSAFRAVYKDGRGKLVCDNMSFENDKAVSGVSGAELLANQVKALRGMGVTKIKTTAAGTGRKLAAGETSYNGYYTWPRLGYDGPIPKRLVDQMPPDLKKHMGKSNRLLRLFESEEGAAWWKANGRNLRLTFDLGDDSPNIKALERYLAGKRS